VQTITTFIENVRKINANNFDDIALALFKFQSRENKIYNAYLKNLRVDPSRINNIEDIPFLPISFFKTNVVKTGDWTEQTIFSSSGTTGAITSRHYVNDISFYLTHSVHLFESFFGSLESYHFLALLPSYLEREGSSLVAMADYFIRQSNSLHSGFYLDNFDALVKKIEFLKNDKRKVLVLGVSFALLELAENFPTNMSHCIIMETGGMKGRRKEIIREELHAILQERLKAHEITSEYGMTELFSQAYSLQNGYYKCADSMKILIRDVYDPLKLEKIGRTGILKVIDLANIHSCAFIETQDLGRLNTDGHFEVLGRVDNSDSRGCNLLV
jgi:phenylacetate-coenzyme A ligase PaaK-like adenylate-forming protein